MGQGDSNRGGAAIKSKSELISLTRAGRELGIDKREVKGLAWGMGIRLVSASQSLVFPARELDRMRKQLEKIAPGDFPPS